MESPDPSARSVPDHFESFDLTIERIGQAYRVEVTDSPAGARPPIPLDPAHLDPDEITSAGDARLTRDVRRAPVDRQDLRRVGERLFKAIFVDKVAEAFRTSVERARSKGVGLRIRLRLDRAAELATLPWEALWDPDERTFLADQPDLPIVRDLSVTAGASPSDSTATPLRLLALLPEPRGETKLGGATEWSQIREHLAPLIDRGAVVADRLEPPTLEALGKRVEGAPYHVLHVVAHGEPGGRGESGSLKLEDKTGGPDDVTGNELARALERRTAPRLVVLNACHGARAAVDDAFDGMAQHLLSRGVPAVVAMRTSISDEAAVAFASALYRELAKGRTVETAVVEARRALSLGEHRAEWATPALYLRGEDVRVFDSVPADVPRAARGAGVRRAVVTAPAAVVLGMLVYLGYLTWPETYATCPTAPGLHDLEFVRIEPGVVSSSERTISVLQPYCISTKEVSRRDWREVVGEPRRRSDWADDFPMTDVTPAAAEDFLEKLRIRDPGVVYRLPTADEWEYAGRAGQTAKYSFGADPSELHRYGNCDNYPRDDGSDGPAPVGSYKPNPWGLHDVHGNVAEWVQWPEDAGQAMDDEGAELAMRLGGSFESKPNYCGFQRSDVLASIDNRQDTGFRVVRELRSPATPAAGKGSRS